MVYSLLVGLALTQAHGPTAVVMAERSIGPATKIEGGSVKELEIAGSKATLFVPDSWTPKSQPDLWIHFHTAAWFIVQEHQRAKNSAPVLTFNLGQGSTTYAKPFQDPAIFPQWIQLVEKELGIDSGNARLHLTSFSAGYGAVREIIQTPDVLKRTRTLILADSLYASHAEGTTTRQVHPPHVECWLPIARKAIDGQATVVMATSEITPESYAGTHEVARAIVVALGGQMTDVVKGSSPAASDPLHPILRKYEKGRLFVWSYDGVTPETHMTIARRLAEMIIESKKDK